MKVAWELLLSRSLKSWLNERKGDAEKREAKRTQTVSGVRGVTGGRGTRVETRVTRNVRGEREEKRWRRKCAWMRNFSVRVSG